MSTQELCVLGDNGWELVNSIGFDPSVQFINTKLNPFIVYNFKKEKIEAVTAVEGD